MVEISIRIEGWLEVVILFGPEIAYVVALRSIILKDTIVSEFSRYYRFQIWIYPGKILNIVRGDRHVENVLHSLDPTKVTLPIVVCIILEQD